MKRIIFGLMLAMMFCTLVQGANRTVTENDGQGNKKRVIELRDTVINGETVTDTLSIMTYENGTGSSDAPEKWRTHHSSMDWNGFDLGSKTSETVIAVTAIVFVFGLPLLIIFVVFFFRYKNRKAKYRLAEQALASGQQLPENFFKEAAATDIRSKGINNIFVGIGLFIAFFVVFCCMNFHRRILSPAFRQFEEDRRESRRRMDELQLERQQMQTELSRLADVCRNESVPDAFQTFVAGIPTLTKTERRIFDGYAAGLRTREIVEQLDIKDSTLRFHNKNIYEKLGVSSLKQLQQFVAILNSGSAPDEK